MFAATTTNALAARAARFNSNTVSSKVRLVVSNVVATGRARAMATATASWRSPRFSRRDGGGRDVDARGGARDVAGGRRGRGYRVINCASSIARCRDRRGRGMDVARSRSGTHGD
jgi:hypothetical protein